jgi:hypothetical protein
LVLNTATFMVSPYGPIYFVLWGKRSCECRHLSRELPNSPKC